jgi:tetratricopeptide (TPR) repeat protein
VNRGVFLVVFAVAMPVIAAQTGQAPPPPDPNAAFDLGRQHFEQGRFADAIPMLKIARQSSSPDRAAYLLGAAYFQTGAYLDAVRELTPLSTSAQLGEQTLYLLEESHRKLRNAEEAKRAFSELAARYPDSASLHKLMGMAYDSQEKYLQAIVEFQEALEVRPEMPELRFAIGLVYLKLNDFASAKRWMEQELASNPCYTHALYYLAQIEREAQRADIAERALRKAVECDPSLSDAWVSLGSILEEKNRNADALSAFEKAVAAGPANTRARYRLGRALSRAGRTSEAAQQYAVVKKLAAVENATGVAVAEQEPAKPPVRNIVK